MLQKAFQNFICSALSELFVMANDQILNLNHLYVEPDTNVQIKKN